MSGGCYGRGAGMMPEAPVSRPEAPRNHALEEAAEFFRQAEINELKAQAGLHAHHPAGASTIRRTVGPGGLGYDFNEPPKSWLGDQVDFDSAPAGNVGCTGSAA